MSLKRLVCLCNHVTELEINKKLRAGAVTTSEIQKFTTAGTSCGRCIPEIDAIVEKYKTEMIKDPQLRINYK
ncbi:MAG TPA: (2Fe-2S)-binding protein [Prolixibacteraceae bacterium]